MNDSEILAKLKPTELTLGEVAYAIKKVLPKTEWNIFYVRDKANTLRAVHVYWSSVDGGWHVSAPVVAYPYGWNGGYRVFSRNSFEASDDSLLEKFREKVEGVLRIET